MSISTPEVAMTENQQKLGSNEKKAELCRKSLKRTYNLFSSSLVANKFQTSALHELPSYPKYIFTDPTEPTKPEEEKNKEAELVLNIKAREKAKAKAKEKERERLKLKHTREQTHLNTLLQYKYNDQYKGILEYQYDINKNKRLNILSSLGYTKPQNKDKPTAETEQNPNPINADTQTQQVTNTNINTGNYYYSILILYYTILVYLCFIIQFLRFIIQFVCFIIQFLCFIRELFVSVFSGVIYF